MTEEELRKIDVYDIGYTEEENGIGYVVGKSIVTDDERYVARVHLNPKTDDFLETFQALLLFECSVDVRTISIDYRLLTRETVDILKQICEMGHVAGIRLTPENAVLTKDVAALFNDEAFKNILLAVDYVSNDVDVEKLPVDVRKQNSICTVEHIAYQKDGVITDNFNIHISEKLTNEGIKNLAKIINDGGYDKLLLDFYDPGYYRDFLEELAKSHIPENIEIRLLANPLYDQPECYEGLDEVISNKIDIHYNTCNDLNESYREEPYTEGARYYSDIEASGFTDINNYCEMVKMIDSIVAHMEEMHYSQLEMIAYVHDYFKENFIYDPDYENTNHADNANLEKVYGKDRMVCEGFSNLYSAILRRAGILCFTYGTDDHQKNMVRVIDEKYGVDNIALIDPTWDLNTDNNKNSFSNFLVPIDNDLYAKEPEVISIPTSLSMASADYYAYVANSNPVYATNPLGYGIRMLQLMGLSHGDREFLTEMELDEFYKSALANSYLKDKIPYDKIVGATQTVREREGKYTSQQEAIEDHDEMSNELQARGNSYFIAPAIKLMGPPDTEVDVDLYSTKINNYDIRFTNVPPQPSVYEKPRNKREDESFEHYRNYLREFYHNTFYAHNEKENVVDLEVKDEKKIDMEIEDTKHIEDIKPADSITMYRDIDDSGRIFVSKNVFDRFHLTPPRYEVTISNEEVVYELTPGQAVDILNHANNSYSPYIINFIYIELEEKIIPYNEDISKLDSQGEFKNKEDAISPYFNKISKLDDEGELKSIEDKIIPYNNAVSALDSHAEFKNSENAIMPIDDDESDYIPGTSYKKPRGRGIYETDEEYVSYLEEYYDGIFGEKNQVEDKPIFDLLNDNLIPGTNFERPRVRGIYETDEEYVRYLEEYYNEIFPQDAREVGQHIR